MVLSAAVLLLAVVVIGLGASVELVRAVRARHEPAATSQGAAVQAVLDELDARPFLLWFGIAALAVLAPGLLRDATLTGGELGLAVVVLGLAGERGQHLAQLPRTEPGRAGWRAVAGAVLVLGGLAVGFS